MRIDIQEIKHISFGGIDMDDAFDFSDAFIESVEMNDGTILTEAQMDSIQKSNPEWFHEQVCLSVLEE